MLNSDFAFERHWTRKIKSCVCCGHRCIFQGEGMCLLVIAWFYLSLSTCSLHCKKLAAKQPLPGQVVQVVRAGGTDGPVQLNHEYSSYRKVAWTPVRDNLLVFSLTGGHIGEFVSRVSAIRTSFFSYKDVPNTVRAIDTLKLMLLSFLFQLSFPSLLCT